MKKLLFTFYFLLSACYLVHAQSGDWLWASQGRDGAVGGIGVSSDMIAADYSGDCFYTGVLFWGDSIHFGSYSLKNNAVNYYDIYLVKFDNKGNVVWARQSQQNGNQSDGNGYVVSTDGMGNAYIMANFSDTISFGSDTLMTQREINNRQYATQDVFLVKYASNGAVAWAKQSQVASYASGLDGNSVATDRSGNSYITGLFYDTAYFGGKPVIGVLHSDTTSYVFLVKYDANGNVIWAAQSTGHSKYQAGGNCVGVNNSGGVFILGGYTDSVTFGSFKLISPFPDENIFVIKYDTNGNVKWARQGTAPSSYNSISPEAMAADNFGNVYVAGYFWDTLVFAKDTLINTNRQSASLYCPFIVKYDAIGNVKWAKTPKMLDSNAWYAKALSCDDKGDVFMSGGGGGMGLCKICFGNDTLSVIDNTNYDNPGFVVKYDSSGNVICASISRCGGDVNGITSDTSGNYVYLGGEAGVADVFGNDTLSLPYGAVPFIARWRECEPTLSVPEVQIKNSAEVKVYPNPSGGIFNLQIRNYELGMNTNIEVYNELGQQVYSNTFLIPNSQFLINLGNQPQGVYL